MTSNSKKISLLKKLKPRNDKQKEFIEEINQKDFMLIDSVFGTGKSFLCVGLACEWLALEKIERVVITRPSLHLVKDYGFSVGSYAEKSREYFFQMIEYFYGFLGRNVFEQLWKDKIIRMTATEIITGEDYSGSLVIMEESQHCNRDILKLFISRVSRGSKCILIGDSGQNGGDSCFWSKFYNQVDHPNVGKVKFTEEHILRHKDIYDICKQIDAVK